MMCIVKSVGVEHRNSDNMSMVIEVRQVFLFGFRGALSKCKQAAINLFGHPFYLDLHIYRSARVSLGM